MKLRLQQLKRARLMFDKLRQSNNYEQSMRKLQDKNQQMKELAQKQLEVMKAKPSKYYNINSVIMISVGAIGFSCLLKYQHLFKEVIPEKLLVDHPYPDDVEKQMVGKQSLYYYCQSMYFQALSGWTVIFLKRSRMISPIYYIMISMGFLTATYLTDYYKHPNLKHSLWFLYNITFGAILGSYFYQQQFYVLIDALYLLGNSMTFYAAANYYFEGENEGILLSSIGCAVFGILYGLGVLRLFRWGYRLDDWKLFAIVLGALGIIMPWSIYREQQVQDEYEMTNFNPINASLSYSWKQIPQINAFVDAFYRNRDQNKMIRQRIRQQKVVKQYAAVDSKQLLASANQISEIQRKILVIMKNEYLKEQNQIQFVDKSDKIYK